jgi:ATP-dependent protease ClpP protease subunit
MEEIIVSRKIYLYGDISQATEKEAVESIHAINDYDDFKDKHLKNYVREPIILFISSDGGDLFSGFGIRAAIRESITPVITVVNSLAASAGFLIFISGHLRVMSDEAFLMSHSLATGGAHLEKVNETWERIGRAVVLQEMLDKIVKETATKEFNFEKYSEDIYEKKKDIFYSAEEALKYGFTDIVTDFDVPLSVFVEKLMSGEIEFVDEDEDETEQGESEDGK